MSEKLSFFLRLCKNELFIFFFTFLFAFIPRFIMQTQVSEYIKCITGGMILSIIIIHVFPDIYKTGGFVAPITSGASFLLLFSIEKLFTGAPGMERKDSDSIPENLSKAQTFIFVIALSLHSLFEGLSIPVKEDKELIWNLVGLLGHKWMEAFSVGISIQDANSFEKNSKLFLICFYSGMTPLGIWLGSLASKKFSDNKKDDKKFKIIKDLLIGASAGSFMFIGFMEMIIDVFEDSDTLNSRVKKILTIYLGFIFMSISLYLISFFENED